MLDVNSCQTITAIEKVGHLSHLACIFCVLGSLVVFMRCCSIIGVYITAREYAYYSKIDYTTAPHTVQQTGLLGLFIQVMIRYWIKIFFKLNLLSNSLF